MPQTTNCFQVGAMITCNTTPQPQFVAPQPSMAPPPDFMGAYIRGQQARAAADAAAEDAQIRANAAVQDAQIRALQAQLLQEQIKTVQAQNAAAEDHRQRLQRFRRSLVTVSQCLNEHPKEQCSEKSESDPEFVAARADVKAGLISNQEMLAIAQDIDAKQ
jgi:hypothetical protein